MTDRLRRELEKHSRIIADRNNGAGTGVTIRITSVVDFQGIYKDPKCLATYGPDPRDEVKIPIQKARAFLACGAVLDIERSDRKWIIQHFSRHGISYFAIEENLKLNSEEEK